MGIFIVEIVLKWSGVLKNVYKLTALSQYFCQFSRTLVLEQVIQWGKTIF